MQEKELLSTVSNLIRLHEKLTSTRNDKFNIFTILRNREDEVMLHSRFLYELLNVKGLHQMKQVYLSAFLDVIGEAANIPKISDTMLSNAAVYREKRNIDLLIFLPNGYTIIIENKINAGDQEKQLERYFHIVVDEYRREGNKVVILYLTLDGHSPSALSIGDLSCPVHNISYAVEIGQWLMECCSLSRNHPRLYEVILQYQGLICDLVNTEGEEKELEKNIAELIVNHSESFRSALAIKSALPMAQSQVMMAVFHAFEKELEELAGLKAVNFYQESSRDYYSKKGCSVYPYQVYPIKDFAVGDYELSFCFYIEIYEVLYCGFSFVGKLTEESAMPEFYEVKEIKKISPLFYKQCEDAVEDALQDAKKILSSDISIYYQYFYDAVGNLYDFKRFTDSCVELYANLQEEVKRLCLDVYPMIESIRQAGIQKVPPVMGAPQGVKNDD